MFSFLLKPEVKEGIIGCIYQIGDGQNKDCSVHHRCSDGRIFPGFQSKSPETLPYKRRGAEKADHQQDQISCQVIQAGGIDDAMAADTEHIPQIYQSIRQRGGEEKHPAYEHQHEGVDLLDNIRQLLKLRRQNILLQKEEEAVIKSPHHKVPGCAVPETGKHPHNKNIPHMFQLGNPVASKRNVDIFPEPGTQGDMPSSPEVGNTLGNIGIIEVSHKFKAKHLSEAYCHIGVAAEVKIDLHGVSQTADPGGEHRPVTGSDSYNGIKGHTDVICQQHFFAKAPKEPGHTLAEFVKTEISFHKLCINICIPDNRAGDQLWKHGHIGSEVDKIFLYRDLSFVYINNIGERLEGIERNTYRQRQLPVGNIHRENGVDIVQQEAVIFKKSQDGQIHHYGKPETEPEKLFIIFLPVFMDLNSADIVKEDAEKHQKYVYRFAPGIEDQADDEENCIFQLPWHEKVKDQSHRQEDEKKENTAEYH